MKTAPSFPVLTLVIIIASVSAVPVPTEDNNYNYNNYWATSAQRNYFENPNRFSIYDPSTASASTYHYNAVPSVPTPTPTPMTSTTQRAYPIPTPLGGGQSFVWQSRPDHAYGIQQTHPLLYRNSAWYYPNGIHYAW